MLLTRESMIQSRFQTVVDNRLHRNQMSHRCKAVQRSFRAVRKANLTYHQPNFEQHPEPAQVKPLDPPQEPSGDTVRSRTPGAAATNPKAPASQSTERTAV